MVLGPTDRIRMFEIPVLRVGAVDVEADIQAARRKIAFRPELFPLNR